MGAIISGARRVGADTVQARAKRAATGFAALGIRAGDLIALYLRNDIAFFEASLAAGRVGAHSTPVNWHYAPAEARLACPREVIRFHC